MWVAFGVLYLLRKRPPCVPAVKKKSGLFAGLALQFAGYASVWAFGRRPWTPLVKMPATLEVAVGFLGLLLMAASVVLVVWAIRALGKEWSYQPRLVEGHELKTKGPYAIVRNPIYSGMLGMLVATGVAWSRWEALLGAMTVYLVGAAIRVRSEEALLRAAFGAAYEEYARRVPALIPRPW
jgi:protein-S-isoprenylcysteine O-methyltransferase Ste14